MTQEIILDTQLQSEKNVAWWLYIFHAISFFFSLGMLSFIPLIINYVKRGDSTGTFVYSHHSWQIRTFWWYLVWMALGFVLFVTIIGIPVAWLIWVAAWVWHAYRLIRGFMDLDKLRPMP